MTITIHIEILYNLICTKQQNYLGLCQEIMIMAYNRILPHKQCINIFAHCFIILDKEQITLDWEHNTKSGINKLY